MRHRVSREPEDGAPGPPITDASGAAEEVELLAGSLDHRVEPEIRLEAVERRRFAAEERPQVVPLEDVPVVALEGFLEHR